MPITLISGLPGAGKTLYAVTNVNAMFPVEEGKPKRQVYAHGIPGLDYDALGWKPLEDVTKWPDLPHGSVILIDECQDHMPIRGQGRPPEWIDRLTKHRHLGMDLVLLSQHPMNIDHFVRRLIDAHLHLKRVMGSERSSVLRARGFIDLSDKSSMRDAEKSLFNFPKASFALYKSAEVHTVKRSIPPRVFMLAGVVLAVGAVLVWLIATPLLPSSKMLKKDAPGSSSSSSLSARAGGQHAAGPAVPWGFAERVRWEPRDVQYPESSPAYDRVRKEVVAAPRVVGCFVMDGKCRCYNQQGFEEVLPEATCHWHMGRRFNPYKPDDDKPQPHQSLLASQAMGPERPASASLLGGLVQP